MKNLFLQTMLQAVIGLLPAVCLGFVPDPNHVYAIVNRASGQALEIGGGSNLYDSPHYIDQWGYWGGANQQWRFQAQQTPYSRRNGYLIINRNSNEIIVEGDGINNNDIDQAYPFQAPMATVYNSNNALEAAVWNFTEVASPPNSSVVATVVISGQGYAASTYGPYPGILENPPTSVKKLYNNYSSARDNNTWTSPHPNYYSGPMIGNYYDIQVYDIVDVSSNPNGVPTAGFFNIVNTKSGSALSVEPYDNGDRSVKQIDAGLGYASEEWTFVPSPDYGFYFIVNKKNNLILEVGGGATTNGATVNLWENYQHPWQEWAVLDTRDSHILQPYEFMDGRTVKIYNANAGKVLEIMGGATNNGATADIYNDFSYNYQQWVLRPTALNRVAANSSPSAGSVPNLLKNRKQKDTAGSLMVQAIDESNGIGQAVGLYPNPVANFVRLRVTDEMDASKCSVTIYDVRGSMMSTPFKNGQLDLSGLSAGSYTVTIRDGINVYHQKLTKID